MVCGEQMANLAIILRWASPAVAFPSPIRKAYRTQLRCKRNRYTKLWRSPYRNLGMTASLRCPGTMTEFMVSIQRPAIEHRIRLGQVSKWAQDGGTKEGPAGITRRQKVLRLLEKT
jgi:hypothetical protein